MVTITLYCPHCQSDALVRNGRAPKGKQKYLCRACHRQSREDPTPHAYSEERREEILCAYQERSSLRGLERTFGVSRTTILAWIKKTHGLRNEVSSSKTKRNSLPVMLCGQKAGKAPAIDTHGYKGGQVKQCRKEKTKAVTSS